MQPVPRIRQCSPAASFSNPSRRASLWSERQPAATHTLISCADFWRSSLTLAAIWSNSSSVMSYPLCNLLLYLTGADVSCEFSVEDHYRRNAARPETSRCEKGNFLVRRRLACAYPKSLFGLRQKLTRALDITSGAQANQTGVLAGWFECEVMIKGRNAVGLAEGYSKG